MASFSGTPTLATDAMRTIGALLLRPPSSIARSSSQSRNRAWNPNHGIVFGSNALSTMPKSPRLASMISSNSTETNHGRHFDIEDSYVFAGSFQSEVPDSQASTGSILVSGEGQEGSSYAPSSRSSASQVSEVQDIALVEENMAEPLEERERPLQKEIHIPLSFRIPDQVLERVREAAPGSKESYWSHKMYMGPEETEVKVHYCRTKHTTERVAAYFVNDKILGFDIEWKPEATKNAGIKKNVALIQLANEERIALFHVALYPGDTVDSLVAPTLKKIMEDPGISKVGVAIKADCTRLRTYLQIDPKGIFELSHLYKLVKHSTLGDVEKINKRLVSLATQVDDHLPLPIFKGDVRGSDWTQPLTMDQIMYAAADAYCNFMLYDSLEAKRKQLDPTPPRPFHAELNLPIRLATGAEIPTADEAIEDPEVHLTAVSRVATESSSHPASVIEAAAENVQIESEEDLDPTFASAPKSRSKPKATSALNESSEIKDMKEAPAQPPKTQTIINAEKWAFEHREVHPVTKNNRMPPPSFAALRAYALWQDNPTLTLAQIASALRDPPLRLSTVANYILEVVRVEKVPFEKERILDVFAVWPEGSKAWRYKGLRERVGLVE